MVTYIKNNAIKLATMLRTPVFVKFIRQDKTNIFRLVREGNYEAVKSYLKHGGDPDLKGHWHLKANRTESFTMQWSLLCDAAAFGNVHVLELLARKTGTNKVAKMSRTLWIACRYGHINLVQWLLANTRATVDRCPSCPVINSAENGHFKILSLLLANKLFVNINATNYDGDTVLLIVLTRHSNDGRTSLHLAAELDDVEKVHYLLEEGWNVNEQDNNGMTPLHIACQMGHQETVEVLKRNNADTQMCNNFGQNSADIALRAGHYALAQDLQEEVTLNVQKIRTMTQSRAKDLNVTRWETFVVIADEITSRFFNVLNVMMSSS